MSMRILTMVLSAFFLAACGSGAKQDEKAFLNSLDSAKTEGTAIDTEVIGSILQSIPSPLEISVLLKESGQKYDNTILNSADNVSKFNNNYKKALNLGIYGTDLGYTNIYQQNKDGIRYLSAIKSMADGLNIGQFFDVETIGRLANNSRNLDSLLLITTQNFNSINAYLQSQNRSNLSVLLLAGGWVEAMQITCQVAAKDKKNKDLKDTIGEQKIILENIMLLLSFYKDADPNMASLLKDFEELKSAYDKINIVYTYKESTMEVVDGVAMIKDNSTTSIQITDEDIVLIQKITDSIRTKIIS
jgi:hypothetical protein